MQVSETRSGPDPAVPLVVDLDGTLILSDLLDESFLAALKENPSAVIGAVVPLLRGDKAGLKRRLASAGALDATLVPLRAELVGFLREEKAKGRVLVLATASDRLLVEPLAASLGLFDEFLASDGIVNLGGEAKRKLLVERWGEKGFDYAADRRTDLPVFRSARRAILAGPGTSLRAEVERAGTPVAAEFPDKGGGPRTVAKAIRVKQWVKNVLVFVPLVTGHVLGLAALQAALVAFVALSLCASAIYVLNDLMDLAADRKHHKKKSRPFASGALSIRAGLALVPLLLAGAAALALALTPGARVVLLVYLATTTLYTFFLKRKVLVDVFTLAFLYTLRVLLGGAATNVLVSPWLLAFSVFIFLSLAFVKRASELIALKEQGREGASGRDWFIWDSLVVHVLGVASAWLSGLVLAIYINSDVVKKLYTHPGWLWLLVPAFLYWSSRVWVLVGRGSMDEDPIVFATRDRITWGIALLTLGILMMASRGPFGIPGLME
ncbi:MAG: UbiA family prenyltransferase [Holophagales bacterium]|nr:UbiA family prenyltransferase [Holophagales bacterium]MBK9967100.1 UbiA family prenyltransferase [Holophagales bacterium]